MKKTREEIIYELLLSLNQGNGGYIVEGEEGTPRVDLAIAQYNALVKRNIIKEDRTCT